MKKNWVLLTFLAVGLCTTTAFAQNNDWGIGLRFGSPNALTVKRYIGKTNALDINVGASRGGYYRNNPYGKYGDNYGFTAMVNYLWRKPIKNAPGLEVYYGVGGLASSYEYYYDRDKRYRNRLGLGVTGAIGLEYFFVPDAPLSLFIEANPYVEFAPSPFWIALIGGIGGRFVF